MWTVADLNRALDRLPRARVRLGDRTVPTYQVAGLSGALAASLTTVALTAATGQSVLVGFGVVALALAAFPLWGLLRRALTGAETYVLLEMLLAILGLQALGLWALGLEVRPGLDRSIVGLCVFMAFGRAGCLVNGCCYGLPAPLGVRYPRECRRAGAPDVRRLPVQAIECGAWVLLAAISAVVVILGRPGDALALVLACYAGLRFSLEGLRADPRPHALGLSESRWISLGLLPLAAWAQPGPLSREALFMGITGGALAAVLWATRRWWWAPHAPPDPALRQRLAEIGRQLRDASPDGVQTWSAGSLVIGASTDADALIVSISRPGQVLTRAEANLHLEPVLRSLGLTEPLPLVAEGRGAILVVRIPTDVPL
ncbi:MAG: prolipoprotein diacylglyceryl transferase [Alphaproteobacteria bacterium]|nr:prolipoprotein diacylglyceryl transferase [Alphaproteobacteria bacterium]